MAAFDSHTGQIAVVQGCDATSAEVFAECVITWLVKAMNASAHQMELVVFDLRRLSDTNGSEALRELLLDNSAQ